MNPRSQDGFAAAADMRPGGEALSSQKSCVFRKPTRSPEMSKLPILLITAIGPLIAGACTASHGGTQSAMAARPADAAYCQSLVNLYTTYAGTVGGSLGGNTRGGPPADLDAKVAIAQCQEGNPEPAIPVLEQKLRDNRIVVPPRR
jgi:hypothetical protein